MNSINVAPVTFPVNTHSTVAIYKQTYGKNDVLESEW